jgi:hypothetical protein
MTEFVALASKRHINRMKRKIIDLPLAGLSSTPSGLLDVMPTA